jgi:hypothetical protein
MKSNHKGNFGFYGVAFDGYVENAFSSPQQNFD